MPANQPPLPVHPGAGVELTQLPVNDIRAELRAGTYVLDAGTTAEVASIHAYVERVGPDNVDQKTLRAVLFSDPAKGFRNSLASLIIEDAWAGYSNAVDGDKPGVYDIAVQGEATSLVSAPTDTFDSMTPAEIAKRVAVSNQFALSHFICQQFVGGRVPAVSGQAEADEYYLDTLNAQTSLIALLDSEFRTLPRSVGDSAVFVASGSIVLRTQVFGLPTLIDTLMERDGIRLTNDQHRRGFGQTLRKSVTPYYRPITYVTVGVNDHLVDSKTLELRPDTWFHNSDPDDLLVYPDPAIVTAVNSSVQARIKQGEQLGNQTGCPAFYSRVQLSPATDVVVPLPRSLPELALGQLDRWYYSHRT